MAFVDFIKLKFEEKISNDTEFQAMIKHYDSVTVSYYNSKAEVLNELCRIGMLTFLQDLMPGEILGKYRDEIEEKIKSKKSIIEDLKTQLDKTKFRKRKFRQQIERSSNTLSDLEKVEEQFNKYEDTYKEWNTSCHKIEKALYCVAESIITENRNDPIIVNTIAEGFELAGRGKLDELRDKAGFDQRMIQTLSVRTAYRAIIIIESEIKNELKKACQSQSSAIEAELQNNSESDADEHE